MKSLLTFLVLLNGALLFGQDTTLLTSNYSGAEKVKIVVRTEELVNGEYIAVDNLTAKIQQDSAWVYYMSYGDGMVSSMMIPFPVMDQFIDFERTIAHLESSDHGHYFMRFEIEEKMVRYPIDLLEVERLSGFMLLLEE